MAAEGRTLVVAPAAVRDTKVWVYEAERIDIEPPQVVSYHEVARRGAELDIRGGTLILDESQRTINSTTWTSNLERLASQAIRVHQATGTPFPNAPYELWGQFHLLYDDEHDFKYKWPFMDKWFVVSKNRYNANARDISAQLAGCHHKGEDAEQCEHWLAFHEANIEGRAIRHRRDDVLKDLPPLTGDDTPLWTPMTPTQAKVYKKLKKEFLASLPEEGIFLEAIKAGSEFSMLHQLSSGLSVVAPDQDPQDKHSGKLILFTELLAERTKPTLVTCWFRNSAKAIARTCDRLGKTYVPLGSSTTARQRDRAVQAFSRGEFDVMIASIGVVKEGIDGLQHGSSEAILFERAWTPGVNEQVIRRLHRLGQQYPVTVRQLVTPNSVDSYQWGDVLPGKARGIRRALSRVELASLI